MQSLIGLLLAENVQWNTICSSCHTYLNLNLLQAQTRMRTAQFLACNDNSFLIPVNVHSYQLALIPHISQAGKNYIRRASCSLAAISAW